MQGDQPVLKYPTYIAHHIGLTVCMRRVDGLGDYAHDVQDQHPRADHRAAAALLDHAHVRGLIPAYPPTRRDSRHTHTLRLTDGRSRIPQPHFSPLVRLPVLEIVCSRQREFLQAHVAKNIVVAATCGTIFWMQGKESEALPTFSNSSFNVSSLWYFAMLYTILSNLQIIPQLFFFRVSRPLDPGSAA